MRHGVGGEKDTSLDMRSSADDGVDVCSLLESKGLQ